MASKQQRISGVTAPKSGLRAADRSVDPAVTVAAVPVQEPARAAHVGERTKRTLYVSTELIGDVEAWHYDLNSPGKFGRFPLANLLDAVLTFALENRQAVEALVETKDGRRERHKGQ